MIHGTGPCRRTVRLLQLLQENLFHKIVPRVPRWEILVIGQDRAQSSLEDPWKLVLAKVDLYWIYMALGGVLLGLDIAEGGCTRPCCLDQTRSQQPRQEQEQPICCSDMGANMMGLPNRPCKHAWHFSRDLVRFGILTLLFQYVLLSTALFIFWTIPKWIQDIKKWLKNLRYETIGFWMLWDWLPQDTLAWWLRPLESVRDSHPWQSLKWLRGLFGPCCPWNLGNSSKMGWPKMPNSPKGTHWADLRGTKRKRED